MHGDPVWAWLTMLSVVLALCTSLQLGGVYFCVIWLLTVLNFYVRSERFPIAPLVGTILIPLGLILLVKFGYPRLWAGFQEHAAQTPAVGGLRFPRLDDCLKAIRTVPGVFGIALLTFVIWLKRGRQVLGELTKIVLLVALVSSAAIFGICMVALGYLTPNYALSAAYLQPLVVAGFLAAIAGEVAFQARRIAWIGMFVALAGLGAVRAIGMSTWGLVCATEVGHTQAIQMIQSSLNETPSRTMVAVSAAYLYEAARHKNIRAIHSDWLAPGRHPEHLVDLIIRERPVKLLLTQFDYYRHFVGPVAQLQRRPDLVDVSIKNVARTPPPDASVRLQKVVQHISWAPVIVEFKWH